MLALITVLDALLFAFLSNCFLLVRENRLLLAFAIAALALLWVLCGLFTAGTKSRRLRVLFHGVLLLVGFCVALTAAILLHALLLFGVLPVSPEALGHSLLYSGICLLALFWQGMLCIYFTSVQLGLRWRVIGLVCGLIPLLNLVVLCIMLRETYYEVIFERQKERQNTERAAQQCCQTRYPILFVHGVFFRDNKYLNYWGRIPGELERNGATCFYGNHQSASSVADSAAELAERIRSIVTQTGCGKLNIIAHSKGGLDCRYAIAHCGVADMVASLTTINTPHRGCLFAKWLLEKTTDRFQDQVATTYNAAAKWLGDCRPDFLAAVTDLRADVCTRFDSETPPPTGILCRSVGSVLEHPGAGGFPLNLSGRFVGQFDGKNDGLVGEESFSWGEAYTLLDLSVRRGISHADMIDLNRENLRGFDVREFYVQMVAALKEKGL